MQVPSNHTALKWESHLVHTKPMWSVPSVPLIVALTQNKYYCPAFWPLIAWPYLLWVGKHVAGTLQAMSRPHLAMQELSSYILAH